jgi:hypothetical protein
LSRNWSLNCGAISIKFAGRPKVGVPETRTRRVQTMAIDQCRSVKLAQSVDRLVALDTLPAQPSQKIFKYGIAAVPLIADSLYAT